MVTKRRLQEKIDNLRRQLSQEREDHWDYVRELRNTAYDIARERMRVKMVLWQHEDGLLEALPILRFEESLDGLNVVVANAVGQQEAR